MENKKLTDGNTFFAYPFELLRGATEETLQPVNLNNCVLRCMFKLGSHRGKLIHYAESGQGITHVDAVNGIAEIDQFRVNFDVSDVTVFFDVELLDNNENPPLYQTIIKDQFLIKHVITDPT